MPTANGNEGTPSSSATPAIVAPTSTNSQGKSACSTPSITVFISVAFGAAGSLGPHAAEFPQQPDGRGDKERRGNGANDLCGLLSRGRRADDIARFQVLRDVAGNGGRHTHHRADSQCRRFADHVGPA